MIGLIKPSLVRPIVSAGTNETGQLFDVPCPILWPTQQVAVATKVLEVEDIVLPPGGLFSEDKTSSVILSIVTLLRRSTAVTVDIAKVNM